MLQVVCTNGLMFIFVVSEVPLSVGESMFRFGEASIQWVVCGWIIECICHERALFHRGKWCITLTLLEGLMVASNSCMAVMSVSRPAGRVM